MNLKRVLIVSLALSMFLLPVGITGRRLAQANQSLHRAEAALALTIADAREVMTLRSRQQRVEHRQRPEEHVLAQVNSVLAEAGIASRSLQSVRPEGDVALPGSNNTYRRQSVLLSFHQLSLVELGRFLESWRNSQVTWTPQRIELTKRRSVNIPDAAYDVTILISAIYLAESSQQ